MSTIPNQNREGARVSKKTSTVNAAMERLQKVRKFKHDSEMHLKARPSSSNLASISEDHESSDHYRLLKGEKLRIQSVPDIRKEKRSCSEPPRRPIPDVPKTAEFAYFKKFKDEMGSNYIKIAGETGQNADEQEIPRCHYAFPSPPRRDVCDCAGESNSKDELRKLESKNSVSPPHSVIKRLDFDHCGEVHAGKGVVGRNKSRQLGVANSYPEDGEGCSKGFDSVPAPVSRMYPQSYEIECSSSEERKIDTTDHLPSSWDPYNEENISTMQNTSKLNRASFYNADFPEYWLDSPRKRVIPKCSSSEERKIEESYQLDALQEPYSEEHISTFNFGSFRDDDIPEYWLERPRKRIISKWDVADVSTHSTEYNAGISSRIEEMEQFPSFPEHQQHDSPRNRVISKWDDIVNSSSPSAEYYAGIGSQTEEMNSFYSLDGEAIRNNVLETDLFCFRSFDDDCFICPEHDLIKMDRSHVPSKLNHTLLLAWDTNPDKDQYTGFSFANSAETASQQTWDDSLAALDMHESSSLANFGVYDEDNPCSIYTHSGGRFLPAREFFEEDYTSSSHILELPSNSREDHVSSLAFVQDFPYVLQQDDFPYLEVADF